MPLLYPMVELSGRLKERESGYHLLATELSKLQLQPDPAAANFVCSYTLHPTVVIYLCGQASADLLVPLQSLVVISSSISTGSTRFFSRRMSS